MNGKSGLNKSSINFINEIGERVLKALIAKNELNLYDKKFKQIREETYPHNP